MNQVFESTLKRKSFQVDNQVSFEINEYFKTFEFRKMIQ